MVLSIKDKLLLPAINIPSNLLRSKQGQSLTLFQEFSRNRKIGSLSLPYKVKKLVFSCEQPHWDCSKIQTISTHYLIHVLLSCHRPQHIAQQPHHKAHGTGICICSSLHSLLHSVLCSPFAT